MIRAWLPLGYSCRRSFVVRPVRVSPTAAVPTPYARVSGLLLFQSLLQRWPDAFALCCVVMLTDGQGQRWRVGRSSGHPLVVIGFHRQPPLLRLRVRFGRFGVASIAFVRVPARHPAIAASFSFWLCVAGREIGL
jgi:hypothetical protein